jgi:multidrug efflux pump subunit AcrA (membrane-fusion protein)
LFVRAEIVTNDRDSGLGVHPSALLLFAGLEKVVTVQDSRALEKIVTTGRRGADWVEIVSGLKAGDVVVLDPGNLRTGQPVGVTPQSPAETIRPLSETSGSQKIRPGLN